MSFRFLHLADLHLDTRFGGREATRARLREATLEAWFAAVELARTTTLSGDATIEVRQLMEVDVEAPAS